MKKIYHFYQLLINKKASTVAGGISFFLLINGGAFLFLVLILTRNTYTEIYLQEEYVPSEVIKVINYFVSNARNSISGSVFVIFTSLWGASSLFYHIIKSGEIIYNTKRRREKMLNRAFSLIAIIAFLILVMVVFFVILATNYILNYVTFALLKHLIQILVYFMLPFILVLFINNFVPPIKIKFRETLLGSLFTTVYWIVATYAFTLFLKLSHDFGAIYGSLAFIIVFLIWIYIMTNGLIIGFIINYQKHQGKKNELMLNTIYE